MIDKDRFCTLSRAKDFQLFLRKLAPDLYQNLVNHLQLGEGCRSNKKKMISIFSLLESNGKIKEVEDFISKNHPHMIKVENKKIINKKKVQVLRAKTKEELYTKMNYHKVFDIYRPRLLFIPQRRIFVGISRESVYKDIIKFIRGKIEVDYLILKGLDLWHGYVEFFDLKYADYIEKLDKSQRPITIYRNKNNIIEDQH